MITYALTTLALLALSAAVPQGLRQPDHAPCTEGATIFVTRGTDEDFPCGSMMSLAIPLADRIPHSRIACTPYPATFTVYEISEAAGVAELTAMIKHHVDTCSDSQIVLLGYSQGAQVTMDVLCGTSEDSFVSTPPLGDHYRDHISAVVVYGDVSHLPKQSYDRGNATTEGLFPRQNPDLCKPLGGRIRSWCHAGDPFCASGANLDQHFTYLENNPEMLEFIVKQL